MPFPYTIDDFTAAMPAVVRDEANRLTANGATLDRFAVQAIVDRYSNDAPLEIVSDVDGNGTSFVDVPVDPDEKGVFDAGFSLLRSIEFPVEQVPPQFLEAEDYRLYRRPGATKIMLSSAAPSASDVLRVTWTARHAADGSTVPDKDFYAVCDYASSLALEALAAIYVQAGDPSINADAVNYRTKSQEYLTLAKAIRKRYFQHMGIEEGVSGTDNPAAMSIGNMNNVQNSGVDRLVHGRGTR
jgi:hypothetical protein